MICIPQTLRNITKVGVVSLLGSIMTKSMMSFAHEKKDLPLRAMGHLPSDTTYIEETWWHSNNMKPYVCRPQRVSDR